MAFWTSNEPGVLPKWIFWLFAIWAPIDFILTIEEATATGSQPRPFSAAVLAICAWCAHKDDARTLVWINVLGALAAFGSALLWRSALPQTLSRTGFENASTGVFLLSGGISTLFAVYLNQFTKKIHTKDAPAISSEKGNLRGDSYSAPQPRGAGSAPSATSAPSEKQLAERGIFDIEHGGTPEEASPDDYAMELSLFEAGDLDQSLWAKHLVEAEGDAEKAKWKYLKERVFTAQVRRADIDRLEKERISKRRQDELEAAKKRLEEARERVQQERAARIAQQNLEAIRDRRAQDNTSGTLILGLVGFLFLLLLIAGLR